MGVGNIVAVKYKNTQFRHAADKIRGFAAFYLTPVREGEDFILTEVSKGYWINRK